MCVTAKLKIGVDMMSLMWMCVLARIAKPFAPEMPDVISVKLGLRHLKDVLYLESLAWNL